MPDVPDTTSRDVEIHMRCKPFRHGGVGHHRLLVQADGAVLVWDGMARYFTRTHSLSASAVREARKRAKELVGA